MAARVTVLGQLTVDNEGRRVDAAAFGARRTRLALAALATAEGRLSAPRLAERLWGDPPPTWPSALRTVITTLRQALEPIGLGGQHLVVTADGGWRIAPGTRTDLGDAETRVRTADPADAEALVADLSAEVLPGDEAPWIDALRERRVGLLREALRLAASAAAADGRWSVAAAHAARSVELDPLDESAHRTLIRALVATGDRAGAIRAFDACRTTLTEELGVDPDTETTALYLEVLQSGGGASGHAPPRPRNRFVGRSAELGAAVDALARGLPVTLVGLGGMGKSRLALEALHDRRLELPGGRYWAALGDVPDAALVDSAVASALGADATADPRSAMVDELAPAGAALLVLDGVERHRDAAADLVAGLLAAVPGLRVLATSRVALGLDGEIRIELGPLRGEGAELLRSRLAERGGPAAAGTLQRRAAAALADRLGDSPLALELAAARLATVSAADLLDGIAQAANDTQSTMTALVEQSWRSLDGEGERLARALGAVDGALPLTLIRALVAAVPGPRAARVLDALADAGFVVVDRASTRWRYRVDPHLAAFVRDRSPSDERTRAAAALVAALDGVAPADATAAPGPARSAVDAALDGFRTVFAAAAEGRGDRDAALDLAFRLHRHWASTSIAEGRYWLGRLLDGARPGEAADLARFAAGYLAYWTGDQAATVALLGPAVTALADRHPDYAARAALYLGGMADDMDEPDRALQELRRALELAARVPGSLRLSVELGLAAVLAERGDTTTTAQLERTLAALPQTASPVQRWFFFASAALAAWRAGDRDAAARYAESASPLLDQPVGLARAQVTAALAGVALQDGDHERALALARETVADLAALGADKDLPLAAAVGVRAALASGDRGAALELARAAVDAALMDSTAALALQSVVALDPGSPAAAALAATAAAIRVTGRRPVPPGLHVPPTAAADPLPRADALALARDVLDRIAASLP